MVGKFIKRTILIIAAIFSVAVIIVNFKFQILPIHFTKGGESNLTILTWNIHDSDPDYKQHQKGIAEEILKQNADIVFLCLPDAAAVEAVSLVGNPDTVVIDTSTAHRVKDGWTYGFPELDGGAQRARIAAAKRIANPGCHASGFISLIRPLTEAGIAAELPDDWPWWSVNGIDEVKAEIQADPRWNDWVKRTQS